MRIFYVDQKNAIEEDPRQFSSFAKALGALEEMLDTGSAIFGQVLDARGLVLVNRATLSKAAISTGTISPA
jgi:hypothetical protein